MNAPRPDSSSTADDQALRDSLREALARTPAEDLRALESRALEQWRLRGAPPQGPLAVLQAGWRHHPLLFKSALLALGLAGLLLIKPWAGSDAGMDELLQPDVLSLMTMGAL